MDTIFVIDVMPLLYRGHFAFLNNPRMTTTGINTSALFSYTSTILQIIEQRNPTHIALVFDSKTATFRHEAYPPYKAQRDKLPEDLSLAIEMAHEFAEAMNLPALRVDGFEADDLMGTLANLAVKSGMEAYLVTPDKDIAQVVQPGVFLYRLGGKNPEVWDSGRVCEHWKLTSPKQMIDYLALSGDASDNIPGVRGVGDKTAQKLLSEYDDIEHILEAARAGKISGKIGQRIAEDADNAVMSKFLTTLRTDVPLAVSLDELRRKESNAEALREFCRKYELSSVAKRLDLEMKAEPEHQSATIATTPHKYRMASSEKDLCELIDELKASGRFAFDTETTSSNAREGKLVGMSFSVKAGEAWYVPYPQKEVKVEAPMLDLFMAVEEPVKSMDLPYSAKSVVSKLAPVFADEKIEKVGHNTKYDREVLARFGMEVKGPCHDTMLMHFALDSSERHGLDRLAKIYLDYEMIPISTLIGDGRNADSARMATLPPEDVADYAAEDADMTLQLYHKLLPKIKENGLERAMIESEEPLVQVLLDMEQAGIKVDALALYAFGQELEQEILALEQRIYDAAGESFNLNSPKQLGEILFGKLAIDDKAAKTATGQYETGEDVLLKYVNQFPVVRDVLEWRSAVKLKSTYADKLPGCINPADGRIHTHFSQSFAETGRLASSEPNLQNIPVRTEQGKRIRAAFVPASDNNVLMSADYSQIELRIMAYLSGDESMLEAFRNGRDIHTETASKVFKVDASEVTQRQRTRCKMVNFGIIYGMSTFGLAQRLEISKTEAADFIAEYFRQYPGVRGFMDKAIAMAREKGFAETMLGRRRGLRDISSRNSTIRQAAERNAINTPVQGSAADLIKLAMVRVNNALKRENLKAKLVLQIHDELLLDVPLDEVEKVKEVVHHEMTNAWDLGIPLEVEIGTGATWLEAH